MLRRTKDQLDSTGKPLVISFMCSRGRPGEDGDHVLVLGWTAICFASGASESHFPGQSPGLLSCTCVPAALPCCVLAALLLGKGGGCCPALTRLPVSTLGISSNIQVMSVTSSQLLFPLLSQVVLPQRTFQLHRLKLSEEEETVYSVLFARSRCVPGRSTFSHVLLLFCPWLVSESSIKSSQTVFMVLLIRRIPVPFL